MSNETLLLRLAGPMQSWGTRSRFDRRDTGLEPSKSGVVGLLCAALGRPRTADISDLAGLTMAVRVDQPGTVGVDYQTVEGVPSADGRGSPQTVQSTRWYLADAAFLVAVEGSSDLIDSLALALERPKWFLTLGRKSYVPTPPLFIDTAPGGIDEALRSTPWLATNHGEEGHRKESVQLRVVRDSTPADAHHWVVDHPVSFEPRRFLRRPLRFEWVTLQGDMLERKHRWSFT